MERIKSAIEKAKKNQKVKQSSLGVGGIYSNRSTANLSQEPSSLDDLTYDKTKVVQIDDDHLIAKRIVSHNKNNLISTAFDLLRTQVLRKMEENGWRTLAVTSPSPEAGKTVVAINLAMSIAQQTEKTALLLDLELRRPKTAEYLGINFEVSLNDLIEKDISISDALINPGIPRFVVLAPNKPISNSSEVLVSSRVNNLLTDIKKRYEDRTVIIDLPPVLNSDDTIAILPKIDCVLMVVANGMSTQQEIQDSLNHLKSANLLGVVLNKSEENTKTYY